MIDKEYYKYLIGHDLPDIFFTELDVFTSIKDANVSSTITLHELLMEIKYGYKYDFTKSGELINKLIQGKKNPVYEVMKKKKPAVTYNARFNKYKDTEHLLSTTNLMFLDMDGFSSKHEAEACRSYFLDKNLGGGYDWIVSCSLSLSRIGLHFVVWVDEITDSKDYIRKYEFLNETFFENKLDLNAKKLTQFTVIPADFSIYINENPSQLNISELYKLEQSTTHKKIVRVNNRTKDDSYINTNDDHVNLVNEKSIWSCNIKEEEIMTTPYTFSSSSSSCYNQTDRSVILKFSETPDEIQFINPNEPVYFRDGKEIIKINLFPLMYKKVSEGSRTVTLGAIGMKMIYLNANNPKYSEAQKKNATLNYMLWLNQQMCDPPLSYPEVVNSFNANWKKYLNGKLDVGELTESQRSFWSPDCSLDTNEKRKISCKLYYEQIVAESKRKISDAIEKINLSGEKVTQVKVAEISGLKLPTVKKYWSDDIKSLVKEINLKLKN